MQNCNIELTRVHYYDINHSGRNVQISTISRRDGGAPALPGRRTPNAVIKKNIFGHRWVLKINEHNNKNLKRSRVKLVLYVFTFICIIVAVCFGVFFSIESKLFNKKPGSATGKDVPSTAENDPLNSTSGFFYGTVDGDVKNTKENLKLHERIRSNETLKNHSSNNPCIHCIPNKEVCLITKEINHPQCKQVIDGKDPTGCGGNCLINREYCKLLDEEIMLFQCKLLHVLDCSQGYFNCGNRCISHKLRCDGIFHCSDRSDEHNCNCNLDTHFQCGNYTSCLDNSKKCDGKIDCWDNFDEINCSHACSNNQIACHNGQCVSKENFCDGVYQCADSSDEPKGCEAQKK